MAIISYAVYLYHHFTLSYRDVQELLFERGIDVVTRRFGPGVSGLVLILPKVCGSDNGLVVALGTSTKCVSA